MLSTVMTPSEVSPSEVSPSVQAESQRAEELLRLKQRNIHSRTDRMFAYLMVGQWLAGIVAALLISPRTWSGLASETHLHVWAAVLLGGAITALPVYMALFMPGRTITRHLIAIGQMLTSALLIHLSGGRIETHFHVFGSLAFLACYRDWKVLVTATVVVAADHGLRGMIWPESVYGVMSGASFRFIEHAGWVVFEDIFLGVAIVQNIADMRRSASHQAAMEFTNTRIEEEVRRRTEELRQSVAATAEVNQQLEAANEDLKQKNLELDQFTYIASHDLQEPVRKLVSFSRLLKQDIDGDLNENAERDLKFIVDAAHRMRDLVQALLELSRAGRSAMKSETVGLDHCVDHALEALSLAITDSGATIIRDPLPEVCGDRTMLTQLYQNLVSNGLKFIRDKKPEIRIGARQEGDFWILSVSDNGIGMKSEYAERIFQPFQRLHSRGEFAGTGIGLSICKKTVNRHKGEIWVESEEGKGATFLFSLPVNQITEDPEATSPSEESICHSAPVPQLPDSCSTNPVTATA